MPGKPKFNPKLRDKSPNAQVVDAFKAVCASELCAPGLVTEALMIAYIAMSESDRIKVAEDRMAFFEAQNK